MKELFGQRLREQRIQHGLTLEQLAEKSELSSNYIGMVERGLKEPGLVRVLDIAGVIVQTRPDGLALVFPHRDQPCCCQCHHPLTKRKCRTSAASRSFG